MLKCDVHTIAIQAINAAPLSHWINEGTNCFFQSLQGRSFRCTQHIAQTIAIPQVNVVSRVFFGASSMLFKVIS